MIIKSRYQKKRNLQLKIDLIVTGQYDFSLRLGIRQECALSPLLFHFILEVLLSAQRQAGRQAVRTDTSERSK